MTIVRYTKHFTTIKGFPGYEIKDGEVYHKGKQLKSYDNGQGYRQVKLWKDGKRYTKNVHRLIKGEPNCDVHHKDSNPSNNSSKNLEPISHSENIKRIFNK